MLPERQSGIVPYRHHPQPIKELIHRARYRPKRNYCFANCGRLILAARRSEYVSEITYCEGTWQGPHLPPVWHAWLRYRGEIVDLTFVDGQIGTYVQWLQMDPAEYAKVCVRQGYFGVAA